MLVPHSVVGRFNALYVTPWFRGTPADGRASPTLTLAGVSPPRPQSGDTSCPRPSSSGIKKYPLIHWIQFASTMYGRFAASQVRMSAHNFVACRSPGVIAARSILPTSSTPTLARISPRVWRSPIRKISTMSRPCATYQGSASGSSSMRRVIARASAGESNNVLQIDSSLATAQVFSSTNRGTFNPRSSITGRQRVTAHFVFPRHRQAHSSHDASTLGSRTVCRHCLRQSGTLLCETLGPS